MAEEERPVRSHSREETGESAQGRAGFLVGLVVGAFLGAALALAFAPDRGEKTRRRLQRRVSAMGKDALEGIDRAGSSTRRQLRRRKKRLRAELERLRERARDKARETRENLE